MLAGKAFAFHANQEIEALLLDALARTQLGEREAAERSVERALDLAEPQGHVWICAHRARRARAAGGAPRAPHRPRRLPAGAARPASRARPAGAGPEELAEPLNERELTVLRFLPRNLSAAEIGSELFLSVNTVKTHMRKLYAKLDVHTRAEAVRARAGARTARAVAARVSFTRIV